MNKKILLVLPLALLAASCNQKAPAAQNSSVYEVAEIRLAGELIMADVADTDDKRQRGLSGREPLNDQQGMLFVFEQPGKPTFWMKDMKFPIDIIWIENGVVVDITKNAELQPDTPDFHLRIYSPKIDADSVLELKSGWADIYGVKIGDRVLINR